MHGPRYCIVRLHTKCSLKLYQDSFSQKRYSHEQISPCFSFNDSWHFKAVGNRAVPYIICKPEMYYVSGFQVESTNGTTTVHFKINRLSNNPSPLRKFNRTTNSANDKLPAIFCSIYCWELCKTPTCRIYTENRPKCSDFLTVTKSTAHGIG